jgi:ribonuclease D
MAADNGDADCTRATSQLMIAHRFIDRPQELAELADELAPERDLALDTEFMRERTYFPRLCLVQLATPRTLACIDPLALDDLGPLAALLRNPLGLKVIHAARQDVEALQTRCPEAPTNLFDTQVAAALLGMQPQIGYGELVHRLLGLPLEKAHTRADWTARPLGREQLEYAADDVRHLLPLRDVLLRELQKLDRHEWLDAEMRRLEALFAARASPDEAWQRLRGLEGLDPRRLAAARALARWRELRAIQRDRPRGWILADDALHELVRTLPRNRAELERIASLPRGVIEHCAEDLLAALEESSHLATAEPARRARKPDPVEQARLKALAATVRRIAEQLRLTPEILATRRELLQLLNGDTDVAPLKGWRREVVGEALLRQL